MTAEECKSLKKGARLVVGECFTNGEDDDARPWLGKVVTFTKFENNKWVYYEECPIGPFHFSEIVGIAEDLCIDDPSVPYHLGDMNLIFGEVE